MSKIICAFAGLGKTYLSQKYSNVIDFYLQKFKYIYNENITNFEEYKGLSNKIINKEWPQNYVKKLKEIMNKDKIILVPADEEVRQLLLLENISFVFVLPSFDSKDNLVERYKERGNSEKFIQRAIQNLIDWHHLHYKYETIILKKNEYLEDYLLREKLI